MTLSMRERGSTAILLTDGDELSISPSVTLRYCSLPFTENERFGNQVESERRLISEQYTITHRKLGAGGQGDVYLAVERKAKLQLACKIINIRYPQVDDDRRHSDVANQPLKERHDILKKQFREFQVLEHLCHPNIVAIKKVFWSESNIYIFQELLTGGDLFSYLEFKGGKLSDVEATIVLRQVLEAVGYIHSQGVVHRDLKPDNILLTSLSESSRIVITDFGSARFLPRNHGERNVAKLRMFSVAGTTEFAAPEIYSANPLMEQGSGYTTAADMWSIGCITAALLSGDVIFIDRNNPEYIMDPHGYILMLAARCDLNVVETSDLWKRVGQRPKDFLKRLLVLDENRRMSAKEALAHPWFHNESYKEELDAVYLRAVGSWEPGRRTYKLVEQISEIRNRSSKEQADPAERSYPAAEASPYFPKAARNHSPSPGNLKSAPNSGLCLRRMSAVEEHSFASCRSLAAKPSTHQVEPYNGCRSFEDNFYDLPETQSPADGNASDECNSQPRYSHIFDGSAPAEDHQCHAESKQDGKARCGSSPEL